MAAFTYETRQKISDAWIAQYQKNGKHLSKREQTLLPERYFYSTPHDTCTWMRQLLADETYRTLSALYQTELQALVSVCVPEHLQEEFYYALDQMNQFQMTAGWQRRSLRSNSYEPFVDASVQLLRAYTRLAYYDVPLADLLIGNTTPEIYDHARTETFAYASILAAQIDRGNEATIQAVQNILLGEGNTAMISHELIRGIVMCKNTSLYETLGKFLLAARLQEGARQAVCETMDAGRPEAFLHLFSVIEEHNLIRYSSVKRAVSTWIGIFDEQNVDRISEKLLRLMGQCLHDEAFRQEQLAANDSVAISCALWAIGFYSADDAVREVQSLIRRGTKNQKMTASYFNRSLQMEQLKMQASKEVLLNYPEDIELIACFLSSFMNQTSTYFYRLLRDESTNYYSISPKKVIKPHPMDPEELFDDRQEAEQIYQILKKVQKQIPKKGIVLSPCIFPWYQVTMTQSDIAERLCLIAWMLQDASLLDEAAAWIPLIGQGGRYAGASRASAAQILLYDPASNVRREILFDLMHNPEEYTNRAAYQLAKRLTLTTEDYLKLEKNLKYKKGREGTLALMKKQPAAQLSASIERLLNAKSESCHMGALDLALQLKKEDGTAFAQLVPSLKDFTPSTGREQVLLDELIGGESEAQDILHTPGYGFYDVNRQFTLPPMEADAQLASGLFTHKENDCIRVMESLNALIEANRDLTYQTAWERDLTLGAELERSRRIDGDSNMEPLDAYPFRSLWETFYQQEIKTPQLLLEVFLYQQCRARRADYQKNLTLYKKAFGNGLLKKPPFSNLIQGLRYGSQARTVINVLFRQYVPQNLLAHWGLCGMAKLLAILDTSNDFFTVSEKRWNGEIISYTKRAANLPIFDDMRAWLSHASDTEWGSAFTLRFRLQQYYQEQTARETLPPYQSYTDRYLFLSDYVQCYVRGFWDIDLFYKAIFTFLSLGSILEPASAVEQKGPISFRKARVSGLNAFFGRQVIKPVDGKYRFDAFGDELPAMALAHQIYREIVPPVLKVELKRGEQPTPFSEYIHSIQIIYGIDYMIQILTALGSDPLQRGMSYYSSSSDRQAVLSHLLKISMPNPDETAEDLAAALQTSDITKKRLAELAMYAEQWIPLLEEYLKLPGFASACYYFMAHTSELSDEQILSTVAKYTPLSPEELRDGAFDIHWFFEAYEKLGEKNFKLLYDAAKYSSSGTAHGRARKYADAALGKTDKETLKQEICAKRNKDLLMSIGLLPLPADKQKREADLLDRYQFIQQYKKESRQFGAQRRASEGRAVDIALRNLSVNAGFTDVTRLILRMENKLAETSVSFFDWQSLEEAPEIELMIAVDQNGKSALKCRKNGKALKSIPAKYKKHSLTLQYQAVHKQLKDQYSRTRQMLEQAMEDRTAFEVWELLEMYQNPVVCPIVKPLVLTPAADADAAAKNSRLGFLTEQGLTDYAGHTVPLQPEDSLWIAHPFDLYQSGHWHDYQKLLFDKQLKQPFKQVFRELYVKLSEELEKEESMLFSGNQIQPQKTVGALRGRRWVADYDDGLQKVYYKENIVAQIYAMADWFSPSDIEAPTLEWVVFSDRKTGKRLKIKEIPDIIYSEVMRDVDLAVSVAHAGGVDPETSHSTIEMRRAIASCSLDLFGLDNVRLEGNLAIIHGTLGEYTVHLGSGVVHQMGNAMLFVIPVHSQHRGRIFLPFVDDDPKTAEIMSKILLFAEDNKIKDPNILSQIR